jgi:hypothetical protein
MPDIGFKFTEVGSIAPSGAVDIRILRCGGDASSSERLLNEIRSKAPDIGRQDLTLAPNQVVVLQLE